MTKMVTVKSGAGHVVEMAKISYDRVFGPKGRIGGYTLADESERNEAGEFELTPRALGLPEGVEHLADLSEDQQRAVKAGRAAEAEAEERARAVALQAEADAKVAAQNPRSASGAGSASTSTGDSSQ